MKRKCPITGGQPTSMTDDGWSRMCEGYKEKARDEKENAPNRYFPRYPCLVCKERPEELTIIELPESREIVMEDEMPKRAPGKCECCGEERAVKPVKNPPICSMCENLKVNIKKRPEVVLGLLKELQPDLLSEAPDTSALNSANADLIKEVAELGDKIAAKDEEIKHLNKMIEGYMEQVDGLVDEVDELRDRPEAVLVSVDTTPLLLLALKISMGLGKGSDMRVDWRDVEMLESFSNRRLLRNMKEGQDVSVP